MATLLVSEQGVIVESNEAAEQLLGVEGRLAGLSLADLILDEPEKLARFLKICRRSAELLPGSLTLKGPAEGGVPCRVEGALLSETERGAFLFIRLFSREAATRQFRLLNERIDHLNQEVLNRKRMEARLHIEQGLLHATLSSIGDAVIATDAEGRVNFMNPVAEALTGWGFEEAEGQVIDILFDIESEAAGVVVENPVRQALRERRIVYLANHTTLTSKQGQKIPIEDSAAPIMGADGELAGAVLVFRDVSERKQADLERRRLACVVENSPDFIGISDTAGVPVYVNPAGLAMVGARDMEECQGVAVAEYFVPEEREFVRNIVLPNLYKEGSWRGELHFRHFRTGAAIPVFYDVFRIDDPVTGEPVSFATLTKDITERKRSEESLRHSSEFNRAVMQNMGEGLYTLDAQGMVTYMNPAAERMFGWSLDELRGKKMHDMTHHHRPDGRAYPAEECDGLQVLREGKHVIDFEDVFIRRSGAFFDVVYSASPLMAGGVIGGVVVVFRDTTSSKKHERALIASNAMLLRANEDLKQFAFAASHDLQEPLRMITSYAQLMIRGYRGQLDEQAEACVEAITQGARRMRKLLSDLLTFAQVDESDLAGQQHEVDLNVALKTALENCQSAMESSRAKVTSDSLPLVQGYEPHFVQLFQNLVGNSIKYGGEGAPEVRVTAERESGQWRIAVSDNGIGVAPEYHQRIFGLFKRLHGKELPGTGIGLAICQRVVERYGGRIWVDSELGKGATFHFTVPDPPRDDG